MNSAGLRHNPFVTTLRSNQIAAAIVGLVCSVAVPAQDEVADDEATVETPEESVPTEAQERRLDEASLSEDPEERRRAQALADEGAADKQKDLRFEPYASARVHAINTINIENGNRTDKISDGNSRVGLRADWDFADNWEVFARAEYGIDLVERFSTRGDVQGDGGLEERLLVAGIDNKYFTLSYGRNWSAYYKIAGITDRFAIFGGTGSGTYNAGTGGQYTGTGRAPDLLQAKIYVDDRRWLGKFKPFNLNVQYQRGQPIPHVQGEKYDFSVGASAWLEHENELGIGVAYNQAHIVDLQRQAIVDANIKGDAKALAIATRAYGDRWYVGLLYSKLENMSVTELNQYYDAQGVEIYAQWEFKSNWWLIGGFNGLFPDGDENVGEFREQYTVIGGRYSFDSFSRMLYVEYRRDASRLTDGTPGKDEVTFGVRWDFGH